MKSWDGSGTPRASWSFPESEPCLPLAMQCNINARGKAVRLVMGAVLALMGAGLVLLNQLTSLADVWGMALGLGLLAVGAFGIFEGWAGWCVVRALGFRTRI